MEKIMIIYLTAICGSYYQWPIHNRCLSLILHDKSDKSHENQEENVVDTL